LEYSCVGSNILNDQTSFSVNWFKYWLLLDIASEWSSVLIAVAKDVLSFMIAHVIKFPHAIVRVSISKNHLSLTWSFAV
jgi:hypothetical protein